MSDYSSTTTDSGRGLLNTHRTGDRAAHVLFRSDLIEHQRVGSPISDVRDAVTVVSETLQARAPDLTDTGFNKLAQHEVEQRIAPSFREARVAIHSAFDDLDKREAPFYRPTFADAQLPAVRVEQRQWARSLSLPQLLKVVQDDPTLAGAIIEGGHAMSGLPADIFARLRREMAVHRATTILSGQRQFAVAATADDPVAGQPDHDAARTAGEALIKAFEDERELLATAPDLLANVVTAVALMLDVNRAEAFKVLTE